MFRISIHVMAGGERVPMLHDSHGCPLFFPTLFTTSQLRNAGAAVNTIRNKLADIIVLLRWEVSEKRDLEAEFLRGKFLSLNDILSLRDFAKRDMREERDQGKGGKVVVDFLEARIASVKPANSVHGQQHYNRLSTIADYLEFVANVISQGKETPELVERINRMAMLIRKHRPRGVRGLGNEDEVRTPDPALVDLFMQVGSVGHPLNPFRHHAIQSRNAIIFSLFRYTGMRRGELLSLRIDQIVPGDEPYIWVRRNQDDSYDPRSYQPVSKTKERPLPIPVSLSEQINDYVMNIRAQVPPARRHPYLLVSHRKGATWGQPLSLTALNSQIFARMRTVNPEFSQIHPHAFRHYFNYELSRAIDNRNAEVKEYSGTDGDKPINEARELDVRAFLNGHRDRASGAIYNRRHIREQSERASREVQQSMMNRKRDNKNGKD